MTGPVDVDTFIDFLGRNADYTPPSGSATSPNGFHATSVPGGAWHRPR